MQNCARGHEPVLGSQSIVAVDWIQERITGNSGRNSVPQTRSMKVYLSFKSLSPRQRHFVQVMLYEPRIQGTIPPCFNVTLRMRKYEAHAKIRF